MKVEQKMTVGVAKLWMLPRMGGVMVIESMGSHLSLSIIQTSTEAVTTT